MLRRAARHVLPPFFYSICACQSVFVVAAAAAAQPQAEAAAENGRDITITGVRPRYSRDVAGVRAITVRQDGQMARFESDICPLALGLPRSFASIVEQRIRMVARSAGLRVAGAGCQANLTLIVAEDGKEAVAALRKERPLLFAAMDNAEQLRLRRSKGPVWNWYSVEPRRRDGGPVETVSSVSIDNGLPVQLSEQAYLATNVHMSRLVMPVRIDLTLAFVVLDSQSVDGLSLQQVGDIAAMLGLSRIEYDRVAALGRPSVLHLLGARDQQRGRPQALTRFDRSYLRGLYAGEPGQPFDRQASTIAASLARGAAERPDRGPEDAPRSR